MLVGGKLGGFVADTAVGSGDDEVLASEVGGEGGELFGVFGEVVVSFEHELNFPDSLHGKRFSKIYINEVVIRIYILMNGNSSEKFYFLIPHPCLHLFINYPISSYLVYFECVPLRVHLKHVLLLPPQHQQTVRLVDIEQTHPR